MKWPGYVVAVVAMFGCSPAFAQDAIVPVEKVFDKFSGVAGWFSTGPTRDEGQRKNLQRFGFEIQVGPYLARRDAVIDSLQADADRLERERDLNGGPPAERLDSLKTILRQRMAHQDRRTSTSLAVGVEYSDSYHRVANGLEVRAPVRAFYVGTYLNGPVMGLMRPYVGAIGGFYKILNGAAYDDSTAFDIKDKTTFSFEVLLGAEFGHWPVKPFLELGYQELAFDALEYDDVKDEEFYPLNAPRRIDLSGLRFTMGVVIER